MAGRHGDRAEVVALEIVTALPDIGVGLSPERTSPSRPAVDVTFAYVDRIARSGDDPLDEPVASWPRHGAFTEGTPRGIRCGRGPHFSCSAPSGGWNTTTSPTAKARFSYATMVSRVYVGAIDSDFTR